MSRIVADCDNGQREIIGREIGRNRALLFSEAIRDNHSMMGKRLLCYIWGDNTENHCARIALVGFV